MHQLDGGKSSNIHWARYDEATKTVEIDFRDKNGNKNSTYRYHTRVNPDGTENAPHGFTMAEWRAFQDSPSKGGHFAAYIRKNYRGEKIWSAK